MMKTNGAFGNNEYATTSLGEIQEQPTNDSEEKRKVPSSKSKRSKTRNQRKQNLLYGGGWGLGTDGNGRKVKEISALNCKVYWRPSKV